MDYSQISMVDVAFEIMNEYSEPVNFYTLWDEVSKRKEFDEDTKKQNESSFYTNITLDGRMITVGENYWDLRSRHRFEDVHIDMNDVYNEEEVIEEDDDEVIEDNYNE